MVNEVTAAELVARLDELADRQLELEGVVRQLRSENDSLRSRLTPDLGPRPARTDPQADGQVDRVGRRDLLRTGLAAAGAVAASAAGATLLSPGTAAAASGDGLILGSTANSADATTGLVNTAVRKPGLAVFDTAAHPIRGWPAIYAQATGEAHSWGISIESGEAQLGMEVWSEGDAIRVAAGQDHPLPEGQNGGAIGVSVASTGQGVVASAADIAVWGYSHRETGVMGNGRRGVMGFGRDGDGTGVEGKGPIGVSGYSAKGVAIRGESGDGTVATGGVGGSFVGSKANIVLPAARTNPPRPAPTTDPIAHEFGDLVETGAGELWLCVADGTPGSWRKLGGPTTAGALHVLPGPVRAYDSRPGTAPSTGPKTRLGGSANRTIDLTLNGTGLVAGATAALVNVFLLNATAANGNFTMWANGAARPFANTMVWGGSAGRFSTLAVTALDAQGRCQVNASILTDVAIDVVGYYR